MQNPFDQFDTVPAPLMGAAKPVDPYKAEDQQMQRDAAARADRNADRADRTANRGIGVAERAAGNMQYDNIMKLRGDYDSLPVVKEYRVSVSQLAAGLKATQDATGDNALIYAYAKAMDPGSVVRESEMGMAASGASAIEAAAANLKKQFGIEGGGQLSPNVRDALRREMLHKVTSIKTGYDAQRQRFSTDASAFGIDPARVIGNHDGDAFRDQFREYNEKYGSARYDAPPQPGGTEIGFSGPEADTSAKSPQAFQASLYGAMRNGSITSPADLKAFASGYNSAHGTNYTPDLTSGETSAAIKAAKEGKSFGVELPDVLTPAEQSEVDTKVNDTGGFETVAAGVADTITLGASNKIIAGGRDLLGKGEYDRELLKANAVTDQLAEDRPLPYFGGQVLGGFALPMGAARTPAQIAKVSGAYGAAYGLGSSDSLREAPGNMLIGGGAGATLGYAIPKGFQLAGRGINALRGAPKDIPPLVDPVSGELNQPMDAMPPAGRVQSMQDYGLTQISPGMAGGRSARVLEQGFNNVPGSAGVMEDFNSAASKEVRTAMQGVAQKFGTSKTLNEGGAELQRGAKAWMTRFDDTTSKAYNAIPIADKAPTTLNNTIATLEHLAGKIESNPELAAEIKDPTLAKYLDALNKGGLNWQDLKDFRTFVGNKIGQFRFAEDARTGDYRALYGALSEDMRNSAAAQGPRALSAFNRANSIKAQGEKRIEDSLVRILGADTKGSPEKAAAAVQAMTKGGKGTGDLAKLAQIKASTVKSGAWDEIASTLIHLGGQPANSEGRAFDPKVFVNWYADMSEPARRMLFKPEQRNALDGFVSLNQQLARVKGLTNTSSTTPTMIGSGVIAASGVMAVANPLALFIPVAGGAANYAMAKVWTNPGFVRWFTGYSRAAARSPEAAKAQIGRLSKIASTNPELRGALETLLRSTNDNAARVGQVAASPNQGPQDGQ